MTNFPTKWIPNCSLVAVNVLVHLAKQVSNGILIQNHETETIISVTYGAMLTMFNGGWNQV